MRRTLLVVGHIGHSSTTLGCTVISALLQIKDLENVTVKVSDGTDNDLKQFEPEPLKFSRNYPVYDIPNIDMKEACFTDFGMGENIKRGSDRHYTKQNKYRANQHNFRKR